ncbi:diacylglycerol/lipid kinase family protein [Myceligenerans pegani]|uniref:NAD(+)/NADH kinase n=1 Tax=Myceligenerans pegani TaxID=2776917 RepID=A0ABR9MYG2_9MICO|nr:diacylglycerol kinase family protein [Myceligenerans sp. TRM 65318]MBE1876086.1 NAD(+)/NADH kinase [Myceligenerans sp. TRM 65318]MBE3018357.1 NAD(+)/NADH kinase [Myceligenerans sp. TRM 65318]
MSALRVGVVWNPAKTNREDLERALGAAGSSASPAPAALWVETSEDDPGQGATARALEEGVDVIVAAGGDGTVRAVAERLAAADAEVALGIVPLGTGNLLARNLGVPLGDVAGAFARVLASEPRAVDLGRLEIDLPGGTERHAFAVMAGFGLDAHMITETDDDLKDSVGWLAYVESMGRALSASDTLDVRITADGGRPRHEHVHTLLVGNCGTLQGGINLLPEADPGDGELDLLALSAAGAAGWADTLRNMVWDNGIKRLVTGRSAAESSASAVHVRLRSLELELAEPRVVEIDGEELGETTRFRVTVQPGAVRVH